MIKKTDFDTYACVTTLKINRDENEYSCLKKADETVSRFLSCSELLSENDMIGWQFSADNLSSHIFMESEDQVSDDDLIWIFDKCAEDACGQDVLLKDPFEDGRMVYILSCPGKTFADDVKHKKRDELSFYCDDEDSIPIDLFAELLRIIKETRAIVRVSVTSCKVGISKCGQILISVPGKMTLRMKTMISRTFPQSEVIEFNEDLSNNSLPELLLSDGMKGLLCAIMRRPEDFDIPDKDQAIDKSDENAPEESKNGEQILSVDDGSFTSIENADFSVRTYNCLKRAGIDSMEKLKRMSDDELFKIRNLGVKCIEEIKIKIAEFNEPVKKIPLEATSYMDMLDALIGLEEVKTQIKKIAAFANMKKVFSENGQNDIPINLNMEFVGNPGTAKTTVARIIAGILYETGILPSNEMIEVGRADLVAKYVGQTAVKVKDTFQKAKGKLLFIDEAYSLLDDREGEFGDEAIHTIVQEMENNRNDTVVIFAGYPKKMKEFFSRNPGLRSRIPFHIRFCDYSADEMLQIVELEAKKRGFAICLDARSRIHGICSSAKERDDSGNGRLCRNLVENAILNYATRVYSGNDECIVRERILTIEDFPEDYIIHESHQISEKKRIGFCA